MWTRARWAIATLLLVAAASVLLISHTTNHLHACSTVTDTSSLPKPLTGQGEQSTLRLPVKACNPVDPWTVLPLGALALILILPEYAEVGFGNFGLKRRSHLEHAALVHKDPETGEVKKGAIRNVELRLQTVQLLLLGALSADPSGHAEALYEIGIHWGESWSTDFAKIEDSLDVSTSTRVRKVLEDWSTYDATAGMGRMEFEFDDDGLPHQVEVINGFLSIERHGVDLRNLVGGYIAGSLNGLLAPRGVRYNATLTTKIVGRDVYALDVEHA